MQSILLTDMQQDVLRGLIPKHTFSINVQRNPDQLIESCLFHDMKHNFAQFWITVVLAHIRTSKAPLNWCSSVNLIL